MEKQDITKITQEEKEISLSGTSSGMWKMGRMWPLSISGALHSVGKQSNLLTSLEKPTHIP